MRFVEQLSGNLPAVTGASGDRILGTITMVNNKKASQIEKLFYL
jgi:hypothetical protein